MNNREQLELGQICIFTDMDMHRFSRITLVRKKEKLDPFEVEDNRHMLKPSRIKQIINKNIKRIHDQADHSDVNEQH